MTAIPSGIKRAAALGKFVHEENSSLEYLSPRKIHPWKICPQGKFTPQKNYHYWMNV
jgi:hypothetical protein